MGDCLKQDGILKLAFQKKKKIKQPYRFVS